MTESLKRKAHDWCDHLKNKPVQSEQVYFNRIDLFVRLKYLKVVKLNKENKYGIKTTGRLF